MHKPRDHPVAFYSEVERFDGSIPKDRQIPIRGPGYYETNVDALNSKRNYSNPKLFSESKRFESYGSYLNKNKGKEPGPGQYEIKEVEKKSFNLLYH